MFLVGPRNILLMILLSVLGLKPLASHLRPVLMDYMGELV